VATEAEGRMNAASLPLPETRVSALFALDDATREVYTRLRAEERNRALIDAMESSDVPPLAEVRGLRLVLVPGIFSEEYPETGADGAELKRVAEQAGMRFDVIPLRGTEGLDAAADVIEEWLLRLPADSRVLLFTLSKGSAEVRHALARRRVTSPEFLRVQEAFRRVKAWVSISGSPFGSPQFELVLKRPLPRVVFSALFWFKRWNLSRLRDVLRYRPSAPFVLPMHVQFVQIAACPLQVHLRDRRSKRFRKRLAAYGPNDGFSLLRDLVALPGSFYAVWGADHYLHGAFDLPGRLTRLIAFLARRAMA
jgi:hypothetical protein